MLNALTMTRESNYQPISSGHSLRGVEHWAMSELEVFHLLLRVSLLEACTSWVVIVFKIVSLMVLSMSFVHHLYLICFCCIANIIFYRLALLASIVLAGSSIPRAIRSQKPLPAGLSLLALYGLFTFGNAFRAQK